MVARVPTSFVDGPLKVFVTLANFMNIHRNSYGRYFNEYSWEYRNEKTKNDRTSAVKTKLLTRRWLVCRENDSDDIRWHISDITMSTRLPLLLVNNVKLLHNFDIYLKHSLLSDGNSDSNECTFVWIFIFIQTSEFRICLKLRFKRGWKKMKWQPLFWASQYEMIVFHTAVTAPLRNHETTSNLPTCLGLILIIVINPSMKGQKKNAILVKLLFGRKFSLERFRSGVDTWSAESADCISRISVIISNKGGVFLVCSFTNYNYCLLSTVNGHGWW